MRIRALGLITADAAALYCCRPAWSQLVQLGAHPQSWVQQNGADEAIALLGTAVIWLAAAWLGLGLIIGLVAAAPGAVGRVAHALACVVLPAALRRGLAVGVGLTLLAGPASAQARTQPSGPAPTAATVASTVAAAPPTVAAPAPSAGWPLDPAPRSVAPSVPPPAWPTDPTPPSGPSPTTEPAPPTPVDVTGQVGGTGTVTVRPGDSLWLIAARRLEPSARPAQVEQAWQAWYSRNEPAIGSNPGLIHPGQVLLAPDAPSAGSQ